MSELFKWASVERTFIQQDIGWIQAGAKLLSPSGDDVTNERLESLKLRLEHANMVIKAETPDKSASVTGG